MPKETPENAMAPRHPQNAIVDDATIPRHDPLLTVEVQFDNLETPIRALIDNGASASVISPELATKLGWQERPYPMQMTQADGSKLESRQVVSTQFSMGADKDRKFRVNAVVLDIGARQFIIWSLMVTGKRLHGRACKTDTVKAGIRGEVRGIEAPSGD